MPRALGTMCGVFAMCGAGIAQPCEPAWSTGFVHGEIGTVETLVEFDDGSGPSLFAGGSFTEAGGQAANHVARWDAAGWHPLGLGVGRSIERVLDFQIFDAGTGPRLFAAGNFTETWTTPTRGIVRWDNPEWSEVGGLTGPAATGYALEVFDPGTGPELFLAGQFTAVGGVTANHFASWNGTRWAPIGTLGPSAAVRCLCLHDDGTGTALYLSGSFTSADGIPLGRIARWNGSAYSPLGTGLGAGATALCEFDAGAGPVLYAAGSFTTAGGQPAQRIAWWDGAWHGSSQTINNTVSFLGVDRGGAVPRLYAGGQFTQFWGMPAPGAVVFDGTAWTPLLVSNPAAGTPLRSITRSGPGPGTLHLGGYMALPGTTRGTGILRESAGALEFLGNGVTGGFAAEVRDAVIHDDGAGRALYITGDIDGAGQAAGRVVRWNGQQWQALPGAGAPTQPGYAVASFDDGSGPAVFVSCASGTPTLFRWRAPDQWSALPGGVTAPANVLEVCDIGAGPRLYAGGTYTTAANHNLRRWNGASWDPVGNLMTQTVACITAYDDGSGLTLYIGGRESSSGGGAFVSRLVGNTWQSVGGQPWSAQSGSSVNELAAFDAGNGVRLYAAGWFDQAGLGNPAANLAVWDGSAWVRADPAGNPLDAVTGMTVWGDGGGPALYLSGAFTSIAGHPLNRVARFDSGGWSALGGGLGGPANSLVAFEVGGTRMLCAAGEFTEAEGHSSGNFAAWVGCAPCYPDCNADGVLNLADFGCFQTRFALGDAYADCNGDGARNLADFGCFQTKFALGCP